MPATSSCTCSSRRRARSTGSSACGAPSWTRNTPPLSEFLLVAVGRIGRGAEAELFAQYCERLRPPIRAIEIADARGTPGEKKKREAAALLAALPVSAFVVALDAAGTMHDSAAFSRLLT